MSEVKKCVLCGKKFTEWGNDPWPLAEDGWCCDQCNALKVIPARLARLRYRWGVRPPQTPKVERRGFLIYSREMLF